MSLSVKKQPPISILKVRKEVANTSPRIMTLKKAQKEAATMTLKNSKKSHSEREKHHSRSSRELKRPEETGRKPEEGLKEATTSEKRPHYKKLAIKGVIVPSSVRRDAGESTKNPLTTLKRAVDRSRRLHRTSTAPEEEEKTLRKKRTIKRGGGGVRGGVRGGVNGMETLTKPPNTSLDSGLCSMDSIELISHLSLASSTQTLSTTVSTTLDNHNHQYHQQEPSTSSPHRALTPTILQTHLCKNLRDERR